MSRRNPNQRARAKRPLGPEAKAALLAQVEGIITDLRTGRLRVDKATGTLVRHKPYWWRFGR